MLISGTVYLFRTYEDSWSEVQKFTADDGLDFDNFGYSVSLFGSTLAIGAPSDGTNSGYILKHSINI